MLTPGKSIDGSALASQAITTVVGPPMDDPNPTNKKPSIRGEKPSMKDAITTTGNSIKKAITGNAVASESDPLWVVGVVVLLIAGAAFGYWYFTKKR